MIRAPDKTWSQLRAETAYIWRRPLANAIALRLKLEDLAADPWARFDDDGVYFEVERTPKTWDEV